MPKAGRRGAAVAAVALVTLAAWGAQAQDGPPRPTFEPDGTVSVPAFELPPSSLMSPQSAAMLRMRARAPNVIRTMNPDVKVARQQLEQLMAPQVAATRQRYPVNIVEQQIAGVPVRVITPAGKPADPRRVLINLHGGAFSICADGCALLESMPIASLGGFKVVTVNYRMAPEAKHPAAVEDVAAVYRELLKQYKPSQIGIYGCSAGGALTAEAAAWLPAHGLPQAGAIGIFGAGGVRFERGDSAYVASYIDGAFLPPPRPGDPPTPRLDRGYFDGVDPDDPIIQPALHPEVIAKFPPTLLITGTRAMDMSPAVYTNTQLLKAGVRSTLIVEEGQGHCYIMQSQLPEARTAYEVIVRHFKENLK
jgi:acetyl esterase/lipase